MFLGIGITDDPLAVPKADHIVDVYVRIGRDKFLGQASIELDPVKRVAAILLLEGIELVGFGIDRERLEFTIVRGDQRLPFTRTRGPIEISLLPLDITHGSDVGDLEKPNMTKPVAHVAAGALTRLLNRLAREAGRI